MIYSQIWVLHRERKRGTAEVLVFSGGLTEGFEPVWLLPRLQLAWLHICSSKNSGGTILVLQLRSLHTSAFLLNRMGSWDFATHNDVLWPAPSSVQFPLMGGAVGSPLAKKKILALLFCALLSFSRLDCDRFAKPWSWLMTLTSWYRRYRWCFYMLFEDTALRRQAFSAPEFYWLDISYMLCVGFLFRWIWRYLMLFVCSSQLKRTGDMTVSAVLLFRRHHMHWALLELIPTVFFGTIVMSF